MALLDNDEVQDNVNQQNLGSRTAGLEEKASACKMLICYTRELKNGFANQAEKVVRVMMPMVKFYFHDRVRTTASESPDEAMDEVLEVIDKFMNQHFQKDEKRTLTLKENYGEYHLSQRIL
ncbi:importin beta-3 [Culex quinquefasciatus]|uniref:Importin beta-3 n=1 Tax=Culex quinquefasciatus TaxID=7176 RepID=B0XEP7_CULQU|nr:importin beta-3 [Culex quinquefasciatus]|eukprot:XP_001868119.1 importin beta-3 [Culex quinquefasciatus]